MEKVLLTLVTFAMSGVYCTPTTLVDVGLEAFKSCGLDLQCVRTKASDFLAQPEMRITEDLKLVKRETGERELEDGDVLDRFDDFLQRHELVARLPEVLRAQARSLEVQEVRVPLAVEGRSKVVKKVIVPFLLGLKFKTAVLVPLALALIALKTWKALTLGLLSLVLTGALLIFKLSKPKINYEVVHFPQHVEHHVEHPPVTGWEHPGGYARQMDAQEMAYSAHTN